MISLSGIRRLRSFRYIVTILTNQGRLSLGPGSKTAKSDLKSLAIFKAKVKSVLTQLGIGVTLFAATGRDEYRKPRTRMWQEVLEEHDVHNHSDLDVNDSIFVGDAGGRASVNGSRADHACSDRYPCSNKAGKSLLIVFEGLCGQCRHTIQNS